MQLTRSIIDIDGAPWEELPAHPAFEGQRASKTFVAPSGQRVALLRLTGVAKGHFHLRTNSFFMVGGRMELRDREVIPGMWGLEPVGAIHPATTFEDAIYGYGMSPGSGGGGPGVVTLPDSGMPEVLASAGFAVDELSHLIDASTLEWEPTETEGLSMKLLHVFAGSSAFAALFRAEDGAQLPSRHYVGPADLFVFDGAVVTSGGEAAAGTWIHEPAGALEGPTRVRGATEWLQNSYGPILDLADDGSIARLIDGFSLVTARGGSPSGAVAVA